MPPAVLQGELTHFKLVDLMKLLSGRSKTGRLQVEKRGVEGSIFFQNGKLVHAVLDMSVGEQAIYELCSFSDGRFSFYPDEAPDMESVEGNTNQLLADCYKRLAEMEAIKKLIPSVDAVYTLVTDKFTKDVSFAPHELEIFSEIDGERSVAQIAQDLKMDQLRVLKAFYKMFVAGMLEFIDKKVAEVPKEKANPEVLKQIERLLTAAVGPISSVIMDDQMAEMDVERNNFPKNMVPQLVERLSQEITNEQRRTEFQQQTLTYIRDI